MRCEYTSGGVAHFSLAVIDPNRSSDWWLSLFDLEGYQRAEGRVIVRNDAIVLVLFAGRPDANVLGHLAFHTGDLTELGSRALRSS